MALETINNDIVGIKVFIPEKYSDNRGCFFESFNQKQFNIRNKFMQDNQSISKKGVIRGMHMQIKPYEQIKLVRVIKGKILDVVVDLRPRSKTYLKSFSIELSDENRKILFVPTGCVHGFLSLEDDTIVSYKVNNYWNKESERGFRYDDPTCAIDWKLKEYDIKDVIVSDKDKALPYFK
jgi:dTDP-4-dehydrorhamnose 3,5-epimerase